MNTNTIIKLELLAMVLVASIAGTIIISKLQDRGTIPCSSAVNTQCINYRGIN